MCEQEHSTYLPSPFSLFLEVLDLFSRPKPESFPAPHHSPSLTSLTDPCFPLGPVSPFLSLKDWPVHVCGVTCLSVAGDLSACLSVCLSIRLPVNLPIWLRPTEDYDESECVSDERVRGESSRTSVCSKYISLSVYMRQPKGKGGGLCVCVCVFRSIYR